MVLEVLAALIGGVVIGALVVWAVLGARLATTRAALDAERRWEAAGRDSADAFGKAAQDALSKASASFLDLANAVLGQHTERARGDLDARTSAVESLVTPLRGSLEAVQRQLSELDASRRAAYAGLAEQVRSLAEAQERLRGETNNLVTALRAPSVRGRWGEIQLRRVVELAGMVAHCDFVEQKTVESADGRLRPDLVVRLPGGGSVVVDAKVPLLGYLASLDAEDEAARRRALADHARQLRAHVDALARKAYWEQVQPAPELVVLFVPGEPILSAALEAAPDLYEHAVAASVLLTTPTSLIGLLRTIAFGWRQEALADNARAVCDLGRQLHTRLGTLIEHVDRLGRHLDGAIGAYNSTVGTLESRVLVTARRFTELDVTDEDLPEPRRLDRVARSLTVTASRDDGDDVDEAVG